MHFIGADVLQLNTSLAVTTTTITNTTNVITTVTVTAGILFSGCLRMRPSVCPSICTWPRTKSLRTRYLKNHSREFHQIYTLVHSGQRWSDWVLRSKGQRWRSQPDHVRDRDRDSLSEQQLRQNKNSAHSQGCICQIFTGGGSEFRLAMYVCMYKWIWLRWRCRTAAAGPPYNVMTMAMTDRATIVGMEVAKLVSGV